MNRVLPGTTIEAKSGSVEDIFTSIFSMGGIVLSQVCVMTGLEPYTIQNWVKRGYVSSPVAKKYSSSQFSRIITINLLKDALMLESITKLLSYINGHLDDESDDLITDLKLYSYFVEVVELSNGNMDMLHSSIQTVLKEYVEPFEGVRKRVENVLEIMVTAYASAILKKKADLQILELETT